MLAKKKVFNVAAHNINDVMNKLHVESHKLLIRL
jgi:hypothetical protein